MALLLAAAGLGAVLLLELFDGPASERRQPPPMQFYTNTTLSASDALDGMAAFEALDPNEKRVVLSQVNEGDVVNVQVGLRTHTWRHTVSIQWVDDLTYRKILELVQGAHVQEGRKSGTRQFTVCLMKYEDDEWVAEKVGLEDEKDAIKKEDLAGDDKSLWVIPKQGAGHLKRPTRDDARMDDDDQHRVEFGVFNGEDELLITDKLDVSAQATVQDLVLRMVAGPKSQDPNTTFVVYSGDKPLLEVYSPNTRLEELVSDANGLSVRPEGWSGNKRQRSEGMSSPDTNMSELRTEGTSGPELLSNGPAGPTSPELSEDDHRALMGDDGFLG